MAYVIIFALIILLLGLYYRKKLTFKKTIRDIFKEAVPNIDKTYKEEYAKFVEACFTDSEIKELALKDEECLNVFHTRLRNVFGGDEPMFTFEENMIKYIDETVKKKRGLN